MAKTLTVKDAHALMTLLGRQATGQSDITVFNTSDFMSVGELVLGTGMENVFNALNTLLASTMIEVREYKAKIGLMEETNKGIFGQRVRAISYLSKDPKAAGDFNTDVYTNFAPGYTAGENKDAQGAAKSTKSQWEQNPPMPIEQNFYSANAWQYAVTMYEEAVQVAFRDEAEFNKFVAGYVLEHQNDIETSKEAWNRGALVSKIAQIYDMSTVMPGSVINLTEEYNDRFDTSYTTEELLSTQLESFLKFFVSTFKNVSNYLEERSLNFHYSPSKTVGGVTYNLLRHTPKANQRVYLYQPLFTEAEAWVLPGIFNQNRLNIETQYQPVSFWQSEEDRTAIKCVPPVLDADGTQKAGAEVDLGVVIGAILDERALMTNVSLETARTTPVEARKGYRNTWLSFLKGATINPLHNGVIFIMKDAEA